MAAQGTGDAAFVPKEQFLRVCRDLIGAVEADVRLLEDASSRCALGPPVTSRFAFSARPADGYYMHAGPHHVRKFLTSALTLPRPSSSCRSAGWPLCSSGKSWTSQRALAWGTASWPTRQARRGVAWGSVP